MPNAPRSSAAAPPRSQTQQTQQHQSYGHRPQPTSAVESWIEVDSQPSSSSLSSIGDEIITTGLRVGGASSSASAAHRRRRQSQHQAPLHPIHQQQNALARAAMAHPLGMSSQEEYDETESEEDREQHFRNRSTNRSTNARSSASAMAGTLPVIISDADAESSDSEDDAATALGRAPPAATSHSPVFRPQPNAFSHPPHLAHRHSLPSHPHESFRSRRSSVSRSGIQRRSSAGGNGSTRDRDSHVSPLYREDNDAALRASLTTLLSYATAARGLQKTANERANPASGNGGPGPSSRGAPMGGVGIGGGTGLGGGVGPSSQPAGLALVPEGEIPDDNESITAPVVPSIQPSTSRQRTAPRSSPLPKQAERQKRGSASSSRGSRAVKKKRASLIGGDEALLSPTVLTWVVGASVVVLFSVVGFGAGYVIGREVGKQEALTAGMGVNASSTAARVAVDGASSCGRQAVTLGGGGGLKKLRWGGSIMSSGVMA